MHHVKLFGRTTDTNEARAGVQTMCLVWRHKLHCAIEGISATLKLQLQLLKLEDKAIVLLEELSSTPNAQMSSYSTMTGKDRLHLHVERAERPQTAIRTEVSHPETREKLEEVMD